MQPWPDAGNGLSRGGGPRARSPPRTPGRGKSTRGDHRDPRGDPARRGGGRHSVERLPDRALGRTAGACLRFVDEVSRGREPSGNEKRTAAPVRHEYVRLLAPVEGAGGSRGRGALRTPFPARVPAGLRRVAED